MNLDHNFFQVSKLSEDQKKKKKGVHQNWKTFFFPSSSEDQKKSFHQNWKTFSPRIQVKISAQMQAKVKLLEGIRL